MHQKYYAPDYDWDSTNELMQPDMEYTISLLADAGINQDQAKDIYESGYVALNGFETIIDRYYGGALMSINSKNRFRASDFNKFSTEGNCKCRVTPVYSLDDLHCRIQKIQENSAGKLYYRGQTQNYTINRKIANPNYCIPGLGEISLIPSLWRIMLSRNPSSFAPFKNLSLFEWSVILYSQFDQDDIDRRIENAKANGEAFFCDQDFEDSADPVIREFGKYRLDLNAYFDSKYSKELSTYLQHYGLLSPVLDLSSSIEVAIFFATHELVRQDNLHEYRFVGTNNQKAVIYVLRNDKEFVLRYDPDSRLIKKNFPLRPATQHCVIASTDSFCINLPAESITEILELKFDMPCQSNGVKVAQIFPDENSDLFLKALKRLTSINKYVIDFHDANRI